MPVISFYIRKEEKLFRTIKPIRQTDVSHLIALVLRKHLRKNSHTARDSRPFRRSWRTKRKRAAGADTSREALIGTDEKFHLCGPSSAANGH